MGSLKAVEAKNYGAAVHGNQSVLNNEANYNNE